MVPSNEHSSLYSIECQIAAETGSTAVEPVPAVLIYNNNISA